MESSAQRPNHKAPLALTPGSCLRATLVAVLALAAGILAEPRNTRAQRPQTTPRPPAMTPPTTGRPTPYRTPYGQRYPYGQRDPYGQGYSPYGQRTPYDSRFTPRTSPSSRSSRRGSSTRRSSSRRSSSRRDSTAKPDTESTSRQSLAQQGKRVKQLSGHRATKTNLQGKDEFTAKWTAQGDRNLCVICLKPTLISAKSGETFTTALYISNPNSTAADSLLAELLYDATALQPLSADTRTLAALSSDEPEVLVDQGAGLLTVRATLLPGRSGAPDDLVTIKWKALRRTQSARIEFGSATKVAFEGEDLLGQPDVKGDGVLGAMVSVAPTTDPDAQEDELEEELEPAVVVANMTKGGSTKLALYGPGRAMRVGQDFYVDVWLDNPRRLPVGQIKVHLEFAPDLLEVVDEDEDNWVIRDTNILDGPFHEDYPFDLHLRNKALNSLGEIYYGVGVQEAIRLPKGGTFARIRFRPKAAGQANVRFVMASASAEFPTQVTYLGQDILGKTDDAEDGAAGCTIKLIE